MSTNDNTSYWAVRANEAGKEAATEEVLYTGLTRNEALATVASCYQMGDPAEGINYWAAPDDGTLGTMPDDRMDWEKEHPHGPGDADSDAEMLEDSGMALLEKIAQSPTLAQLVKWACDLQERNDAADRWQERDAIAVEAVRGHLRMMNEAALRGLGRRYQ